MLVIVYEQIRHTWLLVSGFELGLYLQVLLIMSIVTY
jgi:hypothetical protein